MSDVTRETFEWIEIDQDFCAESYGVAPCAASLSAGGTECFNTRASCQDPANYNRSTLTLRFCKNQAFLPGGAYYIPSLISANLSAGSINPVGAGSNSSALGTRGGISVQLQDHAHTDKVVDPYLANRMSRDAGYIATERGTFWSKWRVRNPYYLGRAIRHKIGFIEGDNVVDVVTRTYFLTAFEGPDASGNVSIQGQDLLSQFANEKAKAPFASNGKLLNDIDEDDTAITLDPAGIGDEEYPASGVGRFGSELVDFTRVGDVVTMVRARYNSKPGSAKAGAVFQSCLVYDAKSPAFILEDLLINYAAIPPEFLALAQWAQEQTDFMPRLYSAIITTPTGVSELISEMCQQMYFYLVWDERNVLLKLRAIRPAEGDVVYDLNDFRNFVSNSVQLKDLPEQLVTQVWVYYGIINPAESHTEAKNYAVREIIVTDEGSPDKNDIEKIKQIFCRWIPLSNTASAIDLGQKMIARYGAAPRQVSFSLTGKDSALWLGDFVKVRHRLSVDMTGQELPLNIQIMSAQESRAGAEFKYVGQEFVYEAPINTNEKPLYISNNELNVNLRTRYEDEYGVPPVSGDIIRVTIRAGVIIGARGAEDLEVYTGNQLITIASNGTFLIARTLAPSMRRELSARVFRGVGSPYVVGPDTYSMRSDMWEVPCSVAFDTGDWPAGVQIFITQEAGSVIEGEGGYFNWHGALLPGRALSIGSDGGHALKIRYPVEWNNQGTIAGGGGSGLTGIGYFTQNSPVGGPFPYYFLVPSGGGAGRYAAPVPATATFQGEARSASGGSLTAGGYGGISHIPSVYLVGFPIPSVYTNTTRVIAGDGAAPAMNGTASSQGVLSGGAHLVYHPVASFGSRAGNAIISGASMITWINKGDVRGAEVA